MEVIDQFEKKEGYYLITTPMDRIRHMYVDFVIVFVLSLLLFFSFSKKFFTQDNGDNDLIMLSTFIIVYWLYYLLWELLIGRTPGKYFNKAKIVNRDGRKLSASQVMIRFLVRLVPFQFITHYTAYQRPLHDILSKTWVLRK